MKRHVLFIEAGTGWGGSSVHLYRFLTFLDRERYVPTVAVYHGGNGPFLQKIKGLQISIVALRPGETATPGKSLGSTQEVVRSVSESLSRVAPVKRVLKAVYELAKVVTSDIPLAFGLRRVIRQRGIELVVLNNDLQYHLPALIAAVLMRFPCICRKAGIGKGRLIKKLFSPCVDKFIAISQAAAKDYLKDGLPARKLTTVYDGVDVTEYGSREESSTLRGELGICPGDKVVGMIARIDEGKGHSDFLKAASLVIMRRPDTTFLIVGDDIGHGGRLAERLKEDARLLRVYRKVVFAGWRNDVPDVLNAIDVFVQCPSYPEGLCLASLEAMAAGKPAVITCAGGIAETTIDGLTGYVVQPGDCQALSEAIFRLLEDPHSRVMGENARRSARERFDIVTNVQKTEQIFEEVLKKRRSR